MYFWLTFYHYFFLSLQKYEDELQRCISKEFKDTIVTYEQVKDTYSKSIGIDVDLTIIKLLVHCLQSENKVDIIFEDKHCHEYLLKFSSNSQPVTPISETEVSVYILQMREKVLSNRLKHLETEEKNLRSEVKEYLKQGQKITVKLYKLKSLIYFEIKHQLDNKKYVAFFKYSFKIMHQCNIYRQETLYGKRKTLKKESIKF